MKVYKEGDPSQPSFPSNFKVTQRWEGTCTDVVKNSNKFFHIEVQISVDGKARIFTMYGRVGKVSAKEYRYYPSEFACLHDYNALIKKKRDRKKDPYREVDLAITSIGSEGAKEIKKAMNITAPSLPTKQSKLHHEIQRLVKSWFGSTGYFIEMNLKCPLGQLTTEQIDKGRKVLDECKNLINKGQVVSKEVDTLTSQFYSLIPHILPHKINPDTLRLNTIQRVMEKHNTLDTFMSAKNVSSVLDKGSAVDDQYKTLNADLEWLDPSTDLWRWVDAMVHKTRAHNHSALGKIKLHNVFILNRHGEDKYFQSRADRIAGKRKLNDWTMPKILKDVGEGRPDLKPNEKAFYRKANILPLFHGTRNENMLNITTKGLLIRPSGAVYSGSAFGDGTYFASNSTKSLNYSSCKGTYWAKGDASRGFLFLADVCLGDPKIVNTSGFYNNQNIKPHHSVWANGGYLINEEFITYYPSGENQQHQLKYILEIETNAK